MNKDTRTIAGIGALGGLVALLLASPSIMPTNAAQADPIREVVTSVERALAPPPDTDRLLKWNVIVEPGISLEPIGESVVRKIAFGRTEFVRVVETSSGTYSSDALGSPNMRYPGIHRTAAQTTGTLAYWSADGWRSVPAYAAGSFMALLAFDGGEPGTSAPSGCGVVRSADALC